MAFIIGKKIKMDSTWDEDGKVIPVTKVQAGPVVVTQVRTNEKDGYEAFCVGFDNSAKNLSKPVLGHLKDLGKFRYMHEFRKTNDEESYKVGDVIDVSVFEKGNKVKVTGKDKGRGFQGVVKRHGFSGGPKTHGNKDQQRTPGSIGSTGPQRVIKGKKMAGHMGDKTVTIKNLMVVGIDKENNTIDIKGGIPGNRNGIIFIETAK